MQFNATPVFGSHFADHDFAALAASHHVTLHRSDITKAFGTQLAPAVLDEAAANVASLLTGRLRRTASRTGLAPENFGEVLPTLFSEVNEQVATQKRSELIRVGRQLVLTAALARGTQDLHRGRLSRSDVESHHALRQAASGIYADAPQCDCARIIDTAAQIYAECELKGRATYPRTLVSDAVERMRTDESGTARPERTASSIVKAAAKSLGPIPIEHVRIVADYLYYLNGFDAPVTESTLFNRLARRHLALPGNGGVVGDGGLVGDGATASEVVARIIGAARASGGQVARSVRLAVDAHTDRFVPNGLDLDVACHFPEDDLVTNLDDRADWGECLDESLLDRA